MIARRAPLLLLAACSAAAPTGRPDCPAGRATADRPDDEDGLQVHVVYALAADGADRALDTGGTLATSVAVWNGWLAAQTGGPRLRLDTCGGALDVTFFRSRRAEAELAATGVFLRDALEAELLAERGAGPKLYAVYYDGATPVACGGGAWPPALPGRVAALYLRGTPPGAPPCVENPFAPSRASPPGYLEYSMLHEIFHNLGAVAACAPHHTRAGHTSDDPRDLMYAGDLPWRPELLDVGRDDYHGHARAGCLDLARSAFLTPLPPDAQPPPAW
jgi:hypothetical protein